MIFATDPIPADGDLVSFFFAILVAAGVLVSLLAVASTWAVRRRRVFRISPVSPLDANVEAMWLRQLSLRRPFVLPPRQAA